jgi:hypothetical protein
MSGLASAASRGIGKVTQCLGSLGGKEWLTGVAPPSDLADDAPPGRMPLSKRRLGEHG